MKGTFLKSLLVFSLFIGNISDLYAGTKRKQPGVEKEQSFPKRIKLTEPTTDIFEQFPPEIFEMITTPLPWKDQRSLSVVCKRRYNNTHAFLTRMYGLFFSKEHQALPFMVLKRRAKFQVLCAWIKTDPLHSHAMHSHVIGYHAQQSLKLNKDETLGRKASLMQRVLQGGEKGLKEIENTVLSLENECSNNEIKCGYLRARKNLARTPDSKKRALAQ